MVNASVDFVLNDEETLNAEFEVTPDVTYEAVIDLSSATRKHNELSNRDLPDQHPISAITNLEETLYGYGHNIDDLLNTVAGYGDIVTHDTDEFATAEQGALADTALQPGDNISELVNNEGYLKAAALNGYATEGYVNAEIDNITDILDSYGNIVTHNVNEFATAEQGQLADTALQSGDNISELTNNVHYATESFVEDKIEDVTDTFGDIVTHNVSEFATSAQGALADTALQPNDDISELNNDVGYITSASLPTVNNGTLTIQKNGTGLGTFTANQATNTTVNVVVPTQASDVNALPDTTTIADLTTTAQLNALNSGATTTNIGQITTNENDISEINDKIPSQASSSNQLADRDFVNSSIATNTANFIGTFNSVAELEAYSGTLTNNDYAFVQTTDTAGNTLYDRYKWNGTEWLFEYELNNSSFTASQWNAINSGATDTLIDQITTNQGNITTIQTTIGGYGNIVTHNESEFATSAQGTKADTAVQPNDLATVATSGSYTDLDNKPTIGSGVLSIQKTGTTIGTFSANATANNIIDVSIDSTDVTTALGYTPVNPSSLATVATTGDYDDLSNKPTIPTVNDATLTIQKNGVDVQTFTANSATNATANITVPTDTAELSNGAGFITGITSSDVTSALGYTPYNSTNPSGYQTAADVASAISGKQDTLVSGTNIKTINGNSVLGSGDLTISATASFASLTGDPGDNEDLREWFDAKANTDLSNLDATGKSTGASLALPSDNWIDLSIPAQLTPLTAPANGYYCARSSGQLYISICNPLSSMAENEVMSTWLPMSGCSTYLPVRKGQQVKLGYSTAPQYFRFVYAEGEI